MKGITRAAFSAYIAVICLIVLNLFAGPGGLNDYRKLDAYKESIEKNIYDLNDRNKDLIMDSDRLIHQADEVRIQARDLGWFENNEGIIVIKGYDRNKAGYSMGKLLSRETAAGNRDHSLQIIALLSGVSFYIFSGFFRRSHR